MILKKRETDEDYQKKKEEEDIKQAEIDEKAKAAIEEKKSLLQTKIDEIKAEEAKAEEAKKAESDAAELKAVEKGDKAAETAADAATPEGTEEPKADGEEAEKKEEDN